MLPVSFLGLSLPAAFLAPFAPWNDETQGPLPPVIPPTGTFIIPQTENNIYLPSGINLQIAPQLFAVTVNVPLNKTDARGLFQTIFRQYLLPITNMKDGTVPIPI